MNIHKSLCYDCLCLELHFVYCISGLVSVEFDLGVDFADGNKSHAHDLDNNYVFIHSSVNVY